MANQYTQITMPNSTVRPHTGVDLADEQPEEDVIILATRMVILAKLSRVTFALSFIWATVVLLGSVAVSKTDFWCITALLVIGGARTLVGTQEFEWQRVVSKCFGSICQKTKKEEPTICQKTKKEEPTIRPKTVSRQLHSLQFIFCVVSLGLALYRLVKRDFGKPNSHCDACCDVALNRNNALYTYYSLILLEVFIFLAVGVYRLFGFRSRLFRKVTKKCKLEDEHLVSSFYDFVYSKSLNNSSFEGIDLDLIDFSMEKIQSSSYEDQLRGVNTMAALVRYNEQEQDRNESMKNRARKVATTPHALERLLDMLTWSWKDSNERPIITGVATVLNELVYHRIICFRIGAIAGGLDGIASLIISSEFEYTKDVQLQALKMLKTLADEHSRCVTIGRTRGLVAALVSLIDVTPIESIGSNNNEYYDEKPSKICEKSLQILRLLVKITGESAKAIREDIVNQKSALDKLRDVLDCKVNNFVMYALDVVDGLGGVQMPDKTDTYDSIGNTGNAIKILMSLFIGKTHEAPSQGIEVDGEKAEHLKCELNIELKAANILDRLSARHKGNCKRIVACENAVFEIVKKLKDTSNIDISTCAANILRSLYKQEEADENSKVVKEIVDAAEHVMETIKRQVKKQQKDKLLEAYLGLAASMVPKLSVDELKDMPEAVCKLLSHLERPPPMLFRIRRHAIELVSALMMMEEKLPLCQPFITGGHVKKHLESMVRFLSETENFFYWSEETGVDRYERTIERVIEDALDALSKLELSLASSSAT